MQRQDPQTVSVDSTAGGFTLVELLVVVVIIGIMAMVAIPATADFMRDQQIAAQANRLMTGLSVTRSTAITRNADVSMCASADNQQCSGGDWSSGWIVFVDAGGDGGFDAGNDERVRVGEGLDGATVSADRSDVTYTDDGVIQDNATFTVAAAPCEDGKVRVITAQGVGRPDLETGANC